MATKIIIFFLLVFYSSKLYSNELIKILDKETNFAEIK